MNFKELGIKLKSVIDGLVDTSIMKEIGSEARDIVVSRTLKGFGVNDNGDKQTRLKGLSESYKKQRVRLKRSGKLSADTTPKKSNLTKGGKMLQDVKSRATSAQAEVFIGNSESLKKAEYQDKVGRKFMNLSKTEIAKIKKSIEEKLIKDMNKKGL